jgi:Xaa-Pro aminopeptidase
MFHTQTYMDRRERLKREVGSGLVLFFGNDESPMNYADNHYRFRQDSSFLYFWGVDLPGLAAIIDIDEDREILLGRNVSVEDSVVTGPRATLNELGLKSGLHEVADFNQLEGIIRPVIGKGRKIHFLPQYRAENLIRIQRLLKIDPALVNASTSASFIKAVVAQRSTKTEEEIEQIETALSVTFDMHTLAMKLSRPGIYEREAAGAMAGIAYSRGGAGLAYPIIFTVNGHILHNFYHNSKMEEGDIIINDSGAESAMHYASDITRTFPVGGRFNQQQRDIYSIVLNAQEKAIQASRPGVEYRNIHLLTCKNITSGLIALGLMKGDVESAVDAGAHALFMPHGLGHMLGLDVHDMEALGEDYVGYTDEIQRSEQFGIRQLRLARALEPGFVITVEPGLYFIPVLIDQWKAEKKFEEYIDYSEVESFINFGGIRIEDNVLILDDGPRVLGKPVPKSIEDVEAYLSRFS